MTEQLGLLPGVPVDPTVKLTARQRLALEFIAANQPVPSDELGALLHEERMQRGGRGHHRDQLCQWCTDEGKQMGAALRRHGLVRQKRHAGWVLASGYRPSTEGTKQEPRDRGSFPEGF